jgi:hypothetical protein
VVIFGAISEILTTAMQTIPGSCWATIDTIDTTWRKHELTYPFFWDVTLVTGYLLPYVSRQRNCVIFKDQNIQEDETTVLSREVTNQTPNDAASHPRRTDTSTTPLRELKNSHKTQNI